MKSRIFFQNGKKFIKVNHTNWKNYLNLKSPYRTNNFNSFNCALKNNESMCCDSCNVSIGSYTKSCVNIITSLNLQLYEDILIKDNLENEFYNIEIDSNDDNKTI
jgi:hypothetical protein